MSTTNILNNLFNSLQLKESLELNKEAILSNNISFVNRQSQEKPIEAKPSVWKTFDYGEYVALNKVYNFLNHDHFMYFVNEVLINSNRIDHDVEMIIRGKEVELVLYTHDYNDVTEIDIKLSRIIDEIFEDINFIE